jgi:hypothetical protein
MLWVDKYRPTQFDGFRINQDKAAALKKLVAKGALALTRASRSVPRLPS